MTTSHVDQSSISQEAPELDEAFLQRVDLAGLRYKQHDPHRADQVHRALEEEVQLAAFGDQGRDRVPRHGGSER